MADHYLPVVRYIPPEEFAFLGRSAKSMGFKQVASGPWGRRIEMRIDRDDVVKEMETNGFRLEAEHMCLPYQYFLVFKVK